MRPTDKATADSRSVQSFAIIKNTGLGNFVIGRFHTRARNGLSVWDWPVYSRSLPHRQPFSDFFWREGATVHRLFERDNSSSNCPSKLTDKVRWIIRPKLKPFHFQIKTYYLSVGNYETDSPSHKILICLYFENGLFCYKWMSRPRPWVECWRVCFCFLTKIIFKFTIDISMCKIILEVEYFIIPSIKC